MNEIRPDSPRYPPENESVPFKPNLNSIPENPHSDLSNDEKPPNPAENMVNK